MEGVPMAGVGGLVGGFGPRLRAGFCLVPESAYPGANQQVGQGKPLVPVGSEENSEMVLASTGVLMVERVPKNCC